MALSKLDFVCCLAARWLRCLGIALVAVASLTLNAFSQPAAKSNTSGASNNSAADCASISSERSDKIVIDKMKGVKSVESRIQRERLSSAINMQLPEIQSSLNEFVKVIFCEERLPTEATFDRDRSKLLNEVGVLIEVWGEADAKGSVLSYAVVPIRSNQYFDKANDNLKGFYTAIYEIRRGDASLVELQSLFKEKPELQGFANLALAEKFSQRAFERQDKATKTRAYDSARTFFCNSILLLNKAHQSGLHDLRLSEWTALLEYAEGSVTSVARRAISDPAYGGSMKILPKEKIEKCS